MRPKWHSHLTPARAVDRQRDEIDSNGKMSRGILQFQDAFSDSDMSMASGITGKPDNSTDAVQMAEYAVENGYLNRWSCARLVKLLPGDPSSFENVTTPMTATMPSPTTTL